ncbi:pilus assembly protein PilM [Trinickia terrae]|uniref:Pilus assembly protein PilM n=1 Tax=Trinickia terrae TaxID=2571161 RepID=A0A4U1I1F1_9BURK|nr:type IV pilus biogenesis protein PilM [Trinickia terrae]TKC86958.1 pilus assembly protein PilM [Trinickia terrae]
MYLIWVVAALSMIAGAYAMFDAESTPVPKGPSSMALAMNMSLYRQALVQFALANPAYAGSVPAANLAPYLGGSNANPVWQNYVLPNTNYAGSLVVVYATAASATVAITGMEQLAQGSALAGVALGANIVSPGNPSVPLPPALANTIPNGMPVWMAQAYD